MLHEISLSASPVQKSTKHFGLSFAYEAPKIWIHLPEDVCIYVENLSLCKRIYKLVRYVFPQSFSVVLKPAVSLCEQKKKLGFYVPFNSQGHIGTGPQNCHLWDSNPQR